MKDELNTDRRLLLLESRVAELTGRTVPGTQLIRVLAKRAAMPEWTEVGVRWSLSLGPMQQPLLISVTARTIEKCIRKAEKQLDKLVKERKATAKSCSIS